MSNVLNGGISEAEAITRLKKHLPKSNDLTLIILKGHLIVEQELNDILDLDLCDSKQLLNFTFSNRLAVVKSVLGMSDDLKPLYSYIENLNSLRNQLVHNLEPHDLENKVKVFVRNIEKYYNVNQPTNEVLAERLKDAIISLCSLIVCYSAVYQG